MRLQLQDLIKKSVFVECTLPNTEYGICKTKFTTSEDFCVKAYSDDLIAQIIYNNIVEYAIGEFEINYNNLDEEQLRAIISNLNYEESADQRTKLGYGFYGEVLLYSLLIALFGTDVLISKGYFYNPLERGEVKGYDAYHLLQRDDIVELWFGEAKFRIDYKKPIKEILMSFAKTTSEGYFQKNVLAIVKEKQNLTTGKDVIDKIKPITETWKSNVEINIPQELEKHQISLVYPIMIAYEQPKKSDYYGGIENCINYIEELFNTGEYVINTSFPIKMFFVFLPVDDVKTIKGQVIEWISEKKPLI